MHAWLSQYMMCSVFNYKVSFIPEIQAANSNCVWNYNINFDGTLPCLGVFFVELSEYEKTFLAPLYSPLLIPSM